MAWITRLMEEAHLERMIENAVDRVRSETDTRLQALENAQRGTSQTIASPNYLPNSHPEWSKDAYLNPGITSSTVGDNNRECYNWYRQTQATTSLAASSTYALKRSVSGAEHSLWAANEGTDVDIPIWDGVNATFKMGTETVLWDIACPLPTDFVFPGQRYYVSFETIADSATVDLNGAEFYCGFWDNTNGRWIRGDEFEPSYSVYGVPGTRTLNYKVLVTSDGGEQLLSKEITVSNAPNTLTPENHVRLSFSGVAGYLRFEVYRKDGTTYRKVADIRNSIDLQFYDMQEDAGSIESGYPTLSATRPLARQTSVELKAGASPIPHSLLIRVPPTYDRSATASQWFRFGLTAHISDARGLIIRRLMVSEGYGPWTRAAQDLTAKSAPTSTASSAPSPGVIVVEYPVNGPVDCVAPDTSITVIDGVHGTGTARADAIEAGMHVLCGAQALRVRGVKHGTVQELYHITTKSGLTLSCSATHRLIKSAFDRSGRAARFLKVGEELLTVQNGIIAPDVIVDIKVQQGSFAVCSLSLPSPHLFIADGFVSHNEKLPSREGPILVV